VLGSLTGTSPGISFGSVHLPLNVDPYFQIALTKPNLGPLFNSLDFLTASGTGPGGPEQPTFVLPAGAAEDFVGQTIHHAYLVLDYPGTGAVTFTSNAVALELVP